MKLQSAMADGPYIKYKHRPSMDCSLFRRAVSPSVSKPSSRKVARRVNSTSVGVCNREEVNVNIFSGEKYGIVEKAASAAATKRMFRALLTCVGRGRTGTGDVCACARTEL
jgi:hypothetical protein